MSIQGQIASINRYEKAAKALLRKYGNREFTAKQFAEIWGGVVNFNYKNYGLGNFEKIYKWKEMYDFAPMAAPPAPRTPDFTKVCIEDIIAGYTKCIDGINTPYTDEENAPVHYEYPMLTQHVHTMVYTDPIGETFSKDYYTYSLNPEFCKALKQIKLQLQIVVQHQILRKLAKMKAEYAKVKQLATDFDIEDCLEDVF